MQKKKRRKEGRKGTLALPQMLQMKRVPERFSATKTKRTVL